MEERKFSSIEELDAALEEEFKLEQEGDGEELEKEDEVQKPDESSDTTETETKGDDLEDDLYDDSLIEKVVDEKPKDKKEFAFGQLRHENSELKSKLAEAEKYSNDFAEMATQLGYQSADALIEEYRKQKIQKEAKEQNIDPQVYTRLRTMEDKLAKAEQEKAQAYKQQGLSKFDTALNNLASEFNLSEQDKRTILDNMGNDGYTIDDLATLKAPTRVLKGYIADKIAESATQERLAREKKAREMKEDKMDGKTESEEDIQDLIKKEMAAYAKDNNLYKI